MRFGIVVFPGSNCEHDVYHVAKHLLGEEARFLWHKDLSFNGIDCIVLPGGFAHGDYLRGGSMACYAPIMAAVGEFPDRLPVETRLQEDAPAVAHLLTSRL